MADDTPGAQGRPSTEPPAPPRTPAAGPAAFEGLSHVDVLALELPEQRYLVDGLVPVGAVGTIAGVPETHKSWLAQAIAVRVAAGEGAVLGHDVVLAGNVGYWWSDDSTSAEAERVKLYHQVAGVPDDLPVTWFLNAGLELPAGLDRLRATVDQLALDLVVLDSFYNFLGTVDLKDNVAEQVVAALKRDVTDATGCTILIVDHMPWATDSNRGRLRAYGGVFKNAATRFGIYIDAEKNKLWIESRGNSISGFKRTPAYWDADNLELRLVDTSATEEAFETVVANVLKWLVDHPDHHSTAAVRKAIGGRATTVDAALEELKGRDEVRDEGKTGGTWSGEAGTPRYWKATIHTTQSLLDTPSHNDGTRSDEVPPSPSSDDPVPVPIGDGVRAGRGQNLEPDDLEDLLNRHSDIACQASSVPVSPGASDAAREVQS